MFYSFILTKCQIIKTKHLLSLIKWYAKSQDSGKCGKTPENALYDTLAFFSIIKPLFVIVETLICVFIRSLKFNFFTFICTSDRKTRKNTRPPPQKDIGFSAERYEFPQQKRYVFFNTLSKTRQKAYRFNSQILFNNLKKVSKTAHSFL